MTNQGFLFTNVLQIPDLFTSAYGVTASAASVIFPLMFIVAVLHENFLVMKDQMEVCPLSREVMLLRGSTSIRLITSRRSLSPSSFTRTSHSVPCGSPAPWADLRAYHVSR